ncbi:hypothetical protein IU426_26350 [Nocardia farcinica]|uniref:hypothetical protein n=1 Tax=Nocardia farcinica TaxID=37329 RepID=UPI001894721E|nr:hypothetical protein [Nocardia farcinica]MBF6280403.1 hypothetical protein [Nocardia farcinica]MBF6494379.1 hypothetical protein [Nocardia farcinica]MBF6508461.1 hypothetical protein [Nocardia farcinica]
MTFFDARNGMKHTHPRTASEITTSKSADTNISRPAPTPTNIHRQMTSLITDRTNAVIDGIEADPDPPPGTPSAPPTS